MWAAAILASLALVAPARAEPGKESPPPETRSVYRVSWPLDLSITAGATAAVLVPYLLSSSLIRRRCPCDPNEVNAFDRGAIGNTSPLAGTLSDVTAGAVVVVPLALDAFDVGVGPTLLEDGMVFAETLMVNGALATATKYVVQRPLPRTYAGEAVFVSSPSGYRAFYSGHTSLVFAGLSATAMTLRLRHGARIWPWIMTLVVGSSVAFERVADGRHFPSDVIVGAAVGTAIGIVVPWTHAWVRSPSRRFVLTPADHGLAIGLAGTF